MRTIEKILSYNLTEEEKETLLSCGIINGCGGTGSFSFSDFLEKNIESFELFDQTKRKQLLRDLNEICYEHDLDYRLGIGFYKANYRMARKVYKLLHWLPSSYRIVSCISIFLLLDKYGKKFYGVKN